MTPDGLGRGQRVLFVDDEPNVLNGLRRALHGVLVADYESDPQHALQRVRDAETPYAVVVSDMRMPGMSGSALLAGVREASPDTTRVLLTGYSDVDSAIAAINDGQVFRFLCKPCPPDVLRAGIDAALEQYALRMAERELLGRTLMGALDALVDTLAMAHPVGFARTARIRRLAGKMARLLQLPGVWAVEVAAQLGELSVMTLPSEALDCLERGDYADPTVAGMLEALPGLSLAVLGRIPRLEPVSRIVTQQRPVDRPWPDLPPTPEFLPAMVLQAARLYDALRQRGMQRETVLAAMEHRIGSGSVLGALTMATVDDGDERRRVLLAELRQGQTLAADVRSASGVLLAARGHQVSEPLLARLWNYARSEGLAADPEVVVRAAVPAGTA